MYIPMHHMHKTMSVYHSLFPVYTCTKDTWGSTMRHCVSFLDIRFVFTCIHTHITFGHKLPPKNVSLGRNVVHRVLCLRDSPISREHNSCETCFVMVFRIPYRSTEDRNISQLHSYQFKQLLSIGKPISTSKSWRVEYLPLIALPKEFQCSIQVASL